jgi:hypothetical protein
MNNLLFEYQGQASGYQADDQDIKADPDFGF